LYKYYIQSDDSEVNISFEVKSGTKSVTIGIYDEQGRMLKTLLSETIYSDGLHFYNSRLDFLLTGMYFLRIEIGNVIYFEKINLEIRKKMLYS